MSEDNGIQIDRRNGLDRREFIRDYLRPNRPVILTGAFTEWEASRKFSFAFFREHWSDLVVDIRGRPHTLGSVLQRLESGDAGSDLYPCKIDLRQPGLEDLLQMVQPRPELFYPDRTHSPLLPRRLLDGLYDLEIFFGGAGGEFPYLHYDYLGFYAIINQIVGRKEFTLFSPDQQALLYPRPDRPWVSAIENHHAPDLSKYPLFEQAQPIRAILEPGEALFIPRQWYHTARSLEPTISVALDQLCRFNWKLFVEECSRSRRGHPVKQALIGLYLGSLGAILSLQEALQSQL